MMLNNRKKLFFPKLVFIETRFFDPKRPTSSKLDFTDESGKLASIFKLDWTKKVQKVFKHNNYDKSLINPEYRELSEYYENILDNLRFNIEPSYLTEIRRASWTAVLEYNTHIELNSNLEKIYIDPTVSYIYEAFRLLADSAFNLETNYYYRGENKDILPYLLLYKFWKGQVNSNLLLKVTRLDEIITRSINTTDMSDEREKSINWFLNYVNSELDT